MSILDSVGVNQCVVGPTHKACHTLDLIIFFGLSIRNLFTIPLSEVISDHYLVSIQVCHNNNVRTAPRYRIKRTFTSTTTQSFISNLPELPTLIGSPSDPTELDQATEYLESTFRYTLDNVAPVKRKIIRDKKLAPWYNDHTRTLKQTARKL